jgi:YHS domain-containing protein
MNRKLRGIHAGLVLGVVLAFAGCAQETAKPAGKPPEKAGAKPETSAPPTGEMKGQPQTTCPMMDGNKINKSIFLDYKGKRIYFCCGACPALFQKDPDKYMKQMQAAGIALEDAPAAPAAGEKKSQP